MPPVAAAPDEVEDKTDTTLEKPDAPDNAQKQPNANSGGWSAGAPPEQAPASPQPDTSQPLKGAAPDADNYSVVHSEPPPDQPAAPVADRGPGAPPVQPWHEDDADARHQDVYRTVDKQMSDKFNQEHPFAPSGWQPETPPEVYDQAVRQSDKEAQAELREKDSSLEAQMRGTGQKYYRDADGTVQPVIDQETGKPLYETAAKEQGINPDTKQPAWVSRDKYGQKQYEAPDLIGNPNDLTDTNLYADFKNGKPVKVGNIEQLAKSKDWKIAQQAMGVMHARQAQVWQQAIQPMNALADKMSVAYDQAKQQRFDLEPQAESLRQEIARYAQNGDNADPNQTAKLNDQLKKITDQQDALGQQTAEPTKDNPMGGSLYQQRERAALHAAVFTAQFKHDSYSNLAQMLSAKIAANGNNPKDAATMAAVQQARNTWGAAIDQYKPKSDQLAQAAATPTAAAQPAEAGVSQEPHQLAAQGIKGIGGVSVQALARNYGSGQGDVTPASLVKMSNRLSDIKEMLADKQTGDSVRAGLQKENDYLSSLYAQRFTNLDPTQKKSVINATRDPTLKEKLVRMVGGVIGSAGEVFLEAGESAARHIPGAYSPETQQKFQAAREAMQEGPSAPFSSTPEVSKKLNESFLTGTAPQLAGQLVPMFMSDGAASLAARSAGLGEKTIALLGKSAAAATGGAQQGNQMRREAINTLKPQLDAGKISKDEYNKSVGLAELAGTSIGAASFLPFSRMAQRIGGTATGKTFLSQILNRAAKAGTPSVMKWLAGEGGQKALADVVREGTQASGVGFAQTLATDLAAKKIYDPTRDVSATKGLESAQNMGLVGAIMSALSHVAPHAVAKNAKTEPSEADIQAERAKAGDALKAPEEPAAPVKPSIVQEPTTDAQKSALAIHEALKEKEAAAEAAKPLRQSPQGGELLKQDLAETEAQQQKRVDDFYKAKAELRQNAATDLQAAIKGNQLKGDENITFDHGISPEADAAQNQLTALDVKLGEGVGATKERSRLIQIIQNERAKVTGEAPSAPAAQTKSAEVTAKPVEQKAETPKPNEGGEETPGATAELPPTKPLAPEGVAKMGPKEFTEYTKTLSDKGGFTAEAHRLGIAAKGDDAAIAKIDAGRESSVAEFKQAMKDKRTDDALSLASKAQFFREAKEAATGTGGSAPAEKISSPSASQGDKAQPETPPTREAGPTAKELKPLPEGTKVRHYAKKSAVIEGQGEPVDHWLVKMPGETKARALTAEALAAEGFKAPEVTDADKTTASPSREDAQKQAQADADKNYKLASKEYTRAQQAYRARTIGDKEFLSARKRFKDAKKALDNPVVAVNKPKGRSFSVGSHPSGGEDILNAIEEQGGIKSGSTETGGEHDDIKSTFQGRAKLLLRKTGSSPDQMAQELHQMGMIKDADVGTMNAAVEKALRDRTSSTKTLKAQEENDRFERAFLGNEHGKKYLRAMQSVSIDDLKVGDEFSVNGDKFKVIDINPDNGAVKIKDGVTKEIPAGTPVYPDEGKVKKVSRKVDFLDKETEESNAAKETPKETPKEPKGDLFSESEMPFNLAGEEQHAPAAKAESAEPAPAQGEMFHIEQIVKEQDPVKSANAAQELYGDPAQAADRLEKQLATFDSDPANKKNFDKDQRARLKEVVSLLRQRATENPKPTGNAPAPSVRISDKLISGLEALRIHKPGMISAGTPFSLAWDSAIDTAILAIKTGRAVGDAVKLGIARLKEKFPGATDDHVAKFESAIRGVYDKQPEAKAEAKPAAVVPETPSKTPAKKGDFTGISQQVSEERGVSTEPGEGVSLEEAMEHGRAKLKAGFDVEKAIKDFNADPEHKISFDAVTAARAKVEKLAKATNEAEEKYGRTSIQYKQADAAERALVEQIKPWSTQGHRFFMAHQGKTEIDTGTFSGLQRAVRDATGRELTPQEADKAKKIAGEVQGLTKEAKAAQDAVFDKALMDKKVESLEKQIAEKKEQLAAGDLSVKFRQANRPQPKELETRRQELDSLNKQLADARAEAKKSANIPLKEAMAKVKARKPGTPWKPDEAKALWHLAKANYLDKGTEDINDIRAGLATDLGLSKNEIFQGLAAPKGVREITNDMYAKMAARRRVIQQAKQWVAEAKYPGYEKFFRAIPGAFFNLATFGHGTVWTVTHSGKQYFLPKASGELFKDLGRSFKLMGARDGGAYHERMMQDLVRDPNFITAKRAGLANDPFKYQDEYQNKGVVKVFKNIGLMGNRGFDGLKMFRQFRFNQEWSTTPESLKTPEYAKLLADRLNKATGVTNVNLGKLAPASRTIFFAPKMEFARWAHNFGDPVKDAITIGRALHDKTSVTPEVYRNATRDMRQKVTMAGTMLGALALNQALLTATGSKQTINLGNPRSQDWMAFKAFGHNFSIVSPDINSIRFLINIAHDAFGARTKLEQLQATRGDEAGTHSLDYAMTKLSPFAGVARDSLFQSDAYGRPMPWSNDPLSYRSKEHGETTRYSAGEYASKKLLPIPMEEAATEIWKQQGATDDQVSKWLRGIAIGLVAGGTGVRISNDTSGDYTPRGKKQTHITGE